MAAQDEPRVVPPQSVEPDRLEKLEKQVSELQRVVSAQAAEIFRLQLRLARMEKAEAAEAEILQDALVSALADVQVASITEIGKLAPEKIERFLPGLRALIAPHQPAATQVQAINVLARFPQEEAAILLAARGDYPDVRRAAAAALGGSSSDRSFAALRELAVDSDRLVRSRAIDGIGLSKHPSAAEALMKIARESAEPPEIESAIRSLGRRKLPETFELFKERLAHESRLVREACIESFGQLADPRAVELVKPFLAESQPKDTRLVAIQALGLLRDATSVAVLSKLLREDADEYIRGAACQAIAAVGLSEAIEDLLAAFMSDRNERVRQTAWEGLLKIASASIQLEEKLVLAFIERKRKPDAVAMMTRIRQTRPDPANKADVRRIETQVAEFMMRERDFAQALQHWQNLAAGENAVREKLQIAVCSRELGDIDGSLKVLQETLPKLKADSAELFGARLELARTLLRKDLRACVEECHAALGSAALQADLKPAFETIRQEAVKGLVLQLAVADRRAFASEALKGLGKKALGAVLSMAGGSPSAELATGLVEAANLITGKSFPANALSDKEKREEALKAWAEFLKN
jgi:HEAT repeat protein